MKLYCADWVLPIRSSPIRNGAVLIDDLHRIADVGPAEILIPKYPSIKPNPLEHAIILPGLVNAHTHLELSMMKNVVPAGLDFSEWAFQTITTRMNFSEATVLADCEKAIRSMVESGTVAVGDIANHAATALPYLRRSGLYATVFNEVTGFANHIAKQRFEEFVSKIVSFDDERIQQTLAPHAPYSVSKPLFELIGRHLHSENSRTSIHLAESIDEVEFLKTGVGPMKSMIERIGRWDASWSAPGQSPVEYVHSLGLLGDRTMVVHAVHVNENDLSILAETRSFVCTCPRSNARIDVGGTAPVKRMLEAGITVCIGTDSLASCDDLVLWNEMKALHSIHPSIPPETVLKMATLNGAQAIGFGERIGSIETGKDAALIAIRSIQKTEDPFACLVKGLDFLTEITKL